MSTAERKTNPVRMTMEEANDLAENPRFWMCHECDTFVFGPMPCECGGTVDKTSVERMAESFELAEIDDDEERLDQLRLKMFPRINAQVASRQTELEEVREILGASELESTAGAARRITAELLAARASLFSQAISAK